MIKTNNFMNTASPMKERNNYESSKLHDEFKNMNMLDNSEFISDNNRHALNDNSYTKQFDLDASQMYDKPVAYVSMGNEGKYNFPPGNSNENDRFSR